jgi:hypothetical protein
MHHNVPNDGVPADFDHGFWLFLRYFGQARSKPAGKDRNFHRRLLLSVFRSLIVIGDLS